MDNRPVVDDLHTLLAFLKTESTALTDLQALNSAMEIYNVNPKFPTPGPTIQRFRTAELASTPISIMLDSEFPKESTSKVTDYYARRITNKTGAILWVWTTR